MNRTERLNKRNDTVRKIVEEVYNNTYLEDIEKSVKDSLERNISDIVYNTLGFDKRWNSSWEINRNSDLFKRVEQIIRSITTGFELKPSPLKPSQINALQKEFDNAYLNRLEELVREGAEKMALEDFEDVLKKME